MKKSKVNISKFQDPLHGEVTVIEGEHSTVMHNFPSDTNGRWIRNGDTYTYELTPNRAARRKKYKNK